MKIRTRSALFGAIAAATSAAVLSFPASPAQADFGLGTPQVTPDTFRDNVVTAMNGRAFGWQLSIAQDGNVVLSDKRGTAVSQKDTGGASIGMQPTMKMELASVTKNITAVATLKLLRRNGLTVESKVWPYLPQAWDTTKFADVRFRHLLTHTSGINQAWGSMDDAPDDNGWNAMRTTVEYGTVVDSPRQYKNANFGLLRVINAELWNRSGGKKYVTDTYEVENSKGVVIDVIEKTTAVPITAANHTSYVLEYMRKYIFEPAGLYGIGCIAQGTTTGVHSYPLNASQSSDGSVLLSNSEECAGARGIAMSSIQLAQYLTNLRHGTIIEPADLATLDKLRAGWSEDANAGDGGETGAPNGIPDVAGSTGVFFHGGDLLGTNELHTCAITFPDGTEAALLVNSEMTIGDSPCVVLIKAFRAAQ